MHAHLLQYRHWLNWAGKKLNNVILLTPNEQMSAQHKHELQESDLLHARLFSSETGADLLTPVEVIIIDLNKLAERKGVKRVAVQEFGENNLVLVDEGHLGASGKVWRERRTELSRGGFTFEYSATFNQVTKRNESLRNAYGKCLLFDYTYRQFHQDGYGKDYTILNLPEGMEDENSDMYLLGCLLTFYQQHCIWLDKGHHWIDFNLTKPLWVFLAKTVTGKKTKADREQRPDIVIILDFLGWVLAHGDETHTKLEKLLAGQSGLRNAQGSDNFAGHFQYLEGKYAHTGAIDNLYADICTTLFHGQGRLHVVYLTTGEGELHLRCADNPVFGVVNVGDPAALHRMLNENDHPNLEIEREQGFVKQLFSNVDDPASTVNIVVGARRFIAGWNSWRVSTMGLMHVGVHEGPEIIQMFGRGVRLKGWNMSLKRHHKSGAPAPDDDVGLAELERLYIFGLRANYMQTFREILEDNRIPTNEQVTVELPVTWNFARQPNLKLLRLKKNRKYETSSCRPSLPLPGDNAPRITITMNLHTKVQAMSSGNTPIAHEQKEKPERIDPSHIALFNRTRIYDTLLARKLQYRWHNLAIEPETVDQLLKANDWYELYAPPEKLAASNVKQVRDLEDTVINLLTEYASEFWRSQRRTWEYENIEVTKLDRQDPNFIGAYRLSMDARETKLVDDIRSLKANITAGPYPSFEFGAILAKSHAYQPLLYAYTPPPGASDKRRITIRPTPLNKGEKEIVQGLAELAQNGAPCLQGRELFLIRNLTRGRGVSFFDDFKYYPDFIVWLKRGNHQHVLFLDPKGLVWFGPKERKKVQLHHTILDVEDRIRKTDPELRLRAYILSVTPPEKIGYGDGTRNPDDWKEDGVYFLSDPNCLQHVIADALGQNSDNRP